MRQDAKGRRRLDTKRDGVRSELEFAIDNPLNIMPVFLKGVEMPGVDALPPTISDLTNWAAGKLEDPLQPRDRAQGLAAHPCPVRTDRSPRTSARLEPPHPKVPLHPEERRWNPKERRLAQKLASGLVVFVFRGVFRGGHRRESGDRRRSPGNAHHRDG